MKKISSLLVLLFSILSSTAHADFNEGVVTYLMGDYDKAFTTMQSLAETSDLMLSVFGKRTAYFTSL